MIKSKCCNLEPYSDDTWTQWRCPCGRTYEPKNLKYLEQVDGKKIPIQQDNEVIKIFEDIFSNFLSENWYSRTLLEKERNLQQFEKMLNEFINSNV